MIALHSFFAILWVLPTITNQVPTYSSRKSVIDWSKCSTQTNCFCMNDAGKLEKVVNDISKATDETDEGRCNIGMQIKFFSDKLAVVQFQVIGDKNELGNDPQLMLYQGTKKLFGCKFDQKLEKYEIDGDETYLTRHKIVLFEDRISFVAGNIVCAIKIPNVDVLRNDMRADTAISRLTAKLMLTVANAHTVEYQLYLPYVIYLTDDKEKTCNPFLFNTKSDSSDFLYRQLKNVDKDVLNCEEHDIEYGAVHIMRYDTLADANQKEVQIYELACVEDNNAFHFGIKRDKSDVSYELIEEPDQYAFYCTAKFETVCTNPITNCSSSEICPVYKSSTETRGSAKLTCTGNKWIINDDYIKLDAEPVCKRDDIGNMNEAVFVFSSRDDERITPNIRCFDKYDCVKRKSTIVYNEKVNNSNGILRCDDGRELSIYLPSTNETLTEKSNYTCDTGTGRWQDATGAFLPDDAQAQCPGKAKPQVDVILTLENMAVTIGVFVAVCILVTFLIALGVYCYYFKPKFFSVKGKKGWKRKEKSEQLAYSTDLFNKVSQTTVDTAYRIVHGFNLVETLLDTDTWEPKIWEEAYPFLMRFQGAVEKLDHNVSRLFMRYMFLQAKKIIDKHGWVSVKPITNTRKNKKGLMRAVAIRLLSFGFNDPYEDESERFAMSGFRKLGFKAVVQYPHCGLLWSLMFHDRIAGKCRIKADNSIRSFDRKKFGEIIKEIAFDNTIEMADEDVMPEFGTPAEQASFALGGTPYICFHRDEKVFDKHETLTSSVRVKHFAGMGMSLGRNQSYPIITSLNTEDVIDPKKIPRQVPFLEKLHKIADESEWNKIVDQAMKIMVNYGRPLDAKRLQVRFMPNIQQPSDFYSQLKMDQQLFEEAAEQQMKELRKWFAERTDKEELKKATEYTKDSALESAISAQQKEEKNSLAAKDNVSQKWKTKTDVALKAALARNLDETAAAPTAADAIQPAAASPAAPIAPPALAAAPKVAAAAPAAPAATPKPASAAPTPLLQKP